MSFTGLKRFFGIVTFMTVTCVVLFAFISCDRSKTDIQVPTTDVTDEATDNPPESICNHVYDNDCDGECNLCGEQRAVNGHKGTAVSGYASTCTKEGLTDGEECSVCGAVLAEQKVIPALGHDEEAHEGKSATCTETGYNPYITCTRCDYTTYSETKALGHDEEPHKGKSATCTESGYNPYITCTRCNYTTYSEIKALGHDEEAHDGKSATCTESGYNPYVTCTRCDYTTYSEIKALGHDEEAHEGKSATCTEAGYNPYVTCTRCDYTTYSESDALGHNMCEVYEHNKNEHWQVCTRCNEAGNKSNHAFENEICPVCGYGCEHDSVNWTIERRPTCSLEGKKLAVCNSCHATIGVETVGKLPHTPGNNATCTEAQICTVCKEVLVNAFGHTESIIPAVEPDCTDVGYTQGLICNKCGELILEPRQISALGHNVQKLEKVSPGCVDAGLTEGEICSRCKQILIAQSEIAPLGHQAGKVHGYAPTCTEAGLTDGETCQRCQAVLTAQQIIEPLGHKPEAVVGFVPTCTESGLTDGETCQRCEAVLNAQQRIEPLGHKPEAVAGFEPTCTESGLTDCEICQRCQAVLTAQQIIEPLGHKPEAVVGFEPTCTEAGLTDGENCQRCQAVLTAQQIIESLGHKPEAVDGYAPTCTETGLTDGEICNVCSKILKEQKTVPALGHDRISHDGKSATCTEIGYNAYTTCSRCDYTTYSEIKALGHDETEDESLYPTCTSDGYLGGTYCQRCGIVLAEEIYLEALGHAYPSGYAYDENEHWRACVRCSHKERENHHTAEGKCLICGYNIRTTVYYDMSTAPSSYRTKGKAFDFILLDGSTVASASTRPTTYSLSEIEVMAGQELRFQGWVGFKTKSISHFAVFYDDDIDNAVAKPDFTNNAEQAVIDAGGQYRFSIYAPIEGISGAGHTISFAAVLEDGVYIIMKTIKLVTTNSDIEDIADDEIVKAEKDKIGENVSIAIIPTGNQNEYLSSAGLKFTASGSGLKYDTADKAFVFTKSGGLKINIADSRERFAEYFNKFNIAYRSSAPLKLIITYNENGTVLTDVVYLEAGDSMLFGCLTSGYMNNVYSRYITSLDIQILGNSESAVFSLHDITTEKVDVISGESLTYLENHRYRLGIKLAWGGGISYLLDKEDNNTSIGNLINNADTGRLIQQSYYGTKDPSEYEGGYYGGNLWNYNPVQGGNLHNTASRIIDVEINNRSIYIKAQPRDWAKTTLTPSYMENVYTLYSDRIQVDNRFVDFAGYKTNPSRHQELPAFYTIGYLNTFVFYNGNNPWGNGTLTYEDSLAFWGGNSNAYFSMKRGNTETWCAWINKSTDYGLGLYTPNIDILLAGRHMYESNPDATNPSDGACSYVAPLNSFKIVSYKSFEYSYLITSGSTRQIRDKFTEYKDFAGNADLTSPEFEYKSNRVG